MSDARPDHSAAATADHAEAPRFPSPVELTQWLREVAPWSGGAELLGAAPGRVWVGRDLGITFELRVRLQMDGRECVGLLQGGLGGGAGEVVASEQRLSLDGWITGLRVHRERLGVWCQSPELDASLPRVAALWHGAAANPALATGGSCDENLASAVVGALGDEAGARAALDELETRLVGYRTGKRCVIRLRPRGGRPRVGVFVKHFRKFPRGDFQARWSGLSSALHSLSNGRVRLPALVAVLPEARAIVFREIPHEARSVQCAALAEGIIEALVAIHQTPAAADLPLHTVSDELDTVARWETGLAVVGAALEHRETLERLVGKLRSCIRDIGDDDWGVVHRDFHAAQLLQTESTLWIVDWDTLALGHVEVDLATFLAHLVLDEARSGRWHGELAPMERCLATYRERGGRIDGGRLRYYLAAALSRLGALQLARGLNESIVRLMWSAAESIVEGEARELHSTGNGHGAGSR